MVPKGDIIFFINVNSLLVHCGVDTRHYCASTWWPKLNLTVEQQVLCIQPLLGELNDLLMDLLLLI